MTAAEIVAAVCTDDPEIYESNVYRTLDRLLELGVVERVQIGEGRAVLEVPANVLDGVTKQIRRDYGFELRPTTSTLSGSCANCDLDPISGVLGEQHERFDVSGTHGSEMTLVQRGDLGSTKPLGCCDYRCVYAPEWQVPINAYELSDP